MTPDTGTPQPPPEVFFERGFSNFFITLLVGIGAFVSAFGMGNNNPLYWRIFWGVAAVALACFAPRCWRLAIVAGPDQLVVRNYFRTVRINWQDIAGFEPPPPYGTWWKTGLKIRLTDGRVIAATAGGMANWDTGRLQARFLRELEELRHQRAGDRAPDGQPPQPAPDDSSREL